jgi:hypothetical protein
MKKLFLSILLISFFSPIAAIEGMWIPILLEEQNEQEMQAMGMRLSAEDIYSVNQSSLKDAIVIYGRGCTGSIISPEGLALTNHHCGFGVIQRLSTLENDYLLNGFWAMNRDEELRSPGLTVTLMKRMDHVTQEVLEGVTTQMAETMRDSIISLNISAIEKYAADTSGYDTRIRPFYYGNEFYIIFSETFLDIRLVGAPPSDIGKFGGDTDNWMWPRHTGDLALFRIYADTNNKPASYSPDNVPYQPAYHLPISINGVEEGDFAFVFGYPGRTRQYLPAIAVQSIVETTNPVAIELRERRIGIMKAAMKESRQVNIQYASKQAGIANGWKKMIGENRGIRRINAIEQKSAFEQEFMDWATSDPELQAKYGGIIPAFDEIYEELIPLYLSRTYLSEAGLGIELVRFANQFSALVRMSREKRKTDDELESQLATLRRNAAGFFKDYHAPIDEQVMAEMLERYFFDLNPVFHPVILSKLCAEFNCDFVLMSRKVFQNSIFSDHGRLERFLENYRPSHHRRIEKDLVFRLSAGLAEHFIKNISEPLQAYERRLDSLQRIYLQGMMQMQPERRFYPDANFTLRVSYGLVEGYEPRDAVQYNHYTSIDGIMEKVDLEVYDYMHNEKLSELHRNRDFGPYAASDGNLRVGFIASNHTTGGNSGSPVLNADGHLVGVNFDRNWEGTMSDLMYDPIQGRNISVDIRYCLFIIDKFAGAGYLLEEMTLIDHEDSVYLGH